MLRKVEVHGLPNIEQKGNETALQDGKRAAIGRFGMPGRSKVPR